MYTHFCSILINIFDELTLEMERLVLNKHMTLQMSHSITSKEEVQ